MSADINYENTHTPTGKEAELDFPDSEKKDDTSSNNTSSHGNRTKKMNARVDLENKPGSSERSVSFKTEDGDGYGEIIGSPRGSLEDMDSSYINAHRDSMSEHDADDEEDESASDGESNTEEPEHTNDDDYGDDYGNNDQNEFSDSSSDASKSSENKTERELKQSKRATRSNKRRIQFKTIREKDKERVENNDNATKVKDNNEEHKEKRDEDEEEDEDDKGSKDDNEEEEEVESGSFGKEKTKQPKIVDRSPTKRYVRFNELLGEGSFKKVYLAYDSQQGVEVAWNVVKIGNVKKDFMQRTLQEMKLLQTMNHPYIIKFYASWLNKETQSVVFVTEMMSSGTLKEFIRNRPVRLRIVKRWSRHILHALHYMHVEMNPPIIHRDLKCDNIFINGATGDIRIGDMGLASWQRNGNAKSVLGTPEYMAPEMFNEKYDSKVDIYAFGMCVLEMITKETPYMECSSTPQIYKKVMGNILPDSYFSVIDCPIKAFIYLCIKKPGAGEERPSAAELRANPFLKKVENDPSDDIDCEEFIDKSSETRKLRMERKLSATSITDSQTHDNTESINPPTNAKEATAPVSDGMPARARTPSPIPTPADVEVIEAESAPKTVDKEMSDREPHGAENSQQEGGNLKMKPKIKVDIPKLDSTSRGDVLQSMSDVEHINHNATENISPKSPGSTLSDVLHQEMESQSAEAASSNSENVTDGQQTPSDENRRLKRNDTNNSNESSTSKEVQSQSVAIERIRKLVPKGTVIEARFGGDYAWFPGKIEKVNSNGTFDIKYEDNDYEAGVDAELITLIKSSGEKVALKPLIDKYLEKQKLVQQQPQSQADSEQQQQATTTSQDTGSASAVGQKPPLPRRHTAAIPVPGVPASQEVGAHHAHTHWNMVAKNPGGAGAHLNELTIVFQSNGGVSAMFPFNLENDQASAVAAELVETLKLSRTELDSIALNLLQFRQEYEEFRAANTTKAFSSAVERDTQARVSLSDSSAFTSAKRSPASMIEEPSSSEAAPVSSSASVSSSPESLQSQTQTPLKLNNDVDTKTTNATPQLNGSVVADNDSLNTVSPGVGEMPRQSPKTLSNRPTEEEVAEYDRQIQLEQEEYRRIQAEHLERVESLKQQKEQARAQRILLKTKSNSEANIISSGVTNLPQAPAYVAGQTLPVPLQLPERSVSVSSTSSQGTASVLSAPGGVVSAPAGGTLFPERATSVASMPAMGTVPMLPIEIGLTAPAIKQIKTKEELREEAKAKVEEEKAMKKEKMMAESAQLEQKMLDTFTLDEGEKAEVVLPSGASTTVIPQKPTPEMTLNEKRQKDQLQAKMNEFMLPAQVQVQNASVPLSQQQQQNTMPIQQQSNMPPMQQLQVPKAAKNLQHQNAPGQHSQE